MVTISQKDFGASLRKTAIPEQKVIEDRFAVADSTLLSGKGAAPAPVPVVQATPAVPAEPVKEGTLVTRDTFSMPADDYGLIEQLRVMAAREARNANKSEVIRAGLQGLMALEPAKPIAILDGLEKDKPGRK